MTPSGLPSSEVLRCSSCTVSSNRTRLSSIIGARHSSAISLPTMHAVSCDCSVCWRSVWGKRHGMYNSPQKSRCATVQVTGWWYHACSVQYVTQRAASCTCRAVLCCAVLCCVVLWLCRWLSVGHQLLRRPFYSDQVLHTLALSAGECVAVSAP
jgi:hypothetical protein